MTQDIKELIKNGIEKIPIEKPGVYVLKVYDNFKFKLIDKLEMEVAKPKGNSFTDKLIKLTNGLKTLFGTIITTLGIAKTVIVHPDKLTYIVIIFGILLLMIGILHKIAKSSQNGRGFWVGDLAKLILNILKKESKNE